MTQKKLYSVTLVLGADTGMDVEAESPEEAADIAASQRHASLCHACARDVNLGDVCGEIVYLDGEEVLDTTSLGREQRKGELIDELAAALREIKEHGLPWDARYDTVLAKVGANG